MKVCLFEIVNLQPISPTQAQVAGTTTADSTWKGGVMETWGLMPDRDGRHPISRGFEEPVSCAVRLCPCNNGTDLCLIPSMIRIGSDGVCENAAKYKGKS